MSRYKNNHDGTYTPIATNIQIVDAPQEDFVTEGELTAALEDYATKDEVLIQYTTMPTPSVDYLGKIVKYVGETTANYIHGFSYECIFDGVDYIWKLNNTPSSSYKGKNVVHMGDSWVQSYHIAEAAAERVGYNVTNCGFSASAISPYNTAVANVDKFSLINLAKAIRDNDYSEQEAVAGTTWGATLARLKAVDWSTVDVLILSYGVNDMSAQNPIGDTSARDEESVCGALKSAISIFNTINQNMEIIVTTPCYRYISRNNSTITSLKDYKLLDEYRNAIGLTAKECGVKLVDMRALSGINEDNRSVTLKSDGLHPTEIGKRMWADAFAMSLEGGFGGAFDTSVIDVKLDADNLCEDSEKFNHHKKWNATYVDNSVKYLCTSGIQQFSLAILGQKHFDILPTGTKVSLKGYGKKIGTSSHRIGFRVYDATKSTIIIDKVNHAINSATDAPIEYSFTTEAEYTDCWVVFYVNNMTTWENGKALVRDMKCTVELPNSGDLEKVGELPTASSTYEGKSYLLTAPQTGYIEGGIYKCEAQGTSPETYAWVLKNVPLAELQSVVAASSDFADFQTRIASL